MNKFSIFILMSVLAASAIGQDLVGHFAFDNVRTELKELKMVRGETFLPKELFGYVINSVDKADSEILGKYFKQAKGVKGGALLLDGNTSYVVIEEDNVPRVDGDFSVEAWLAMGAYPNNVCPIVDNQRDPAEGYFNGYFFGLDALGRVILRIATNGIEEQIVSTEMVSLFKWDHIAGTYSPKNGLNIYLNGKLVGSKKPDYSFTPPQEHVTVLMGKSRAPMRPYGTIRPHGTKPYDMFYDGLLDEIKIYNSELSADAVKKSYSSVKSNIKPDLEARVMPTGPLKAEWFGAVNTNLKYYEAYDALWHVDKGTDVVVRFDEAPVEFVFWKGSNYNAHLVTEKGFWFNNGFNEGWNHHGSCEPMSDKQTRHSHVKVLENNQARVVVQWRYALVDNWYEFAFYDPATGWGDWTNETYYIYPDMVAVREDVLMSNAPRAQHEWQESMVVPGPGQRPDDLLEFAALTLGNNEGEFHTYSWENETPPHFPPDPKNPNIQLVNMKSEYKPFSILRPQDNPSIDVYSGEIRRDVSVFPWWNHWPVAQKPTDGRYAMYQDRPSHSSLSHWFWDHYKVTERSMTKLMLTGFTNKEAQDLLPISKAWASPAKIKVSGASAVTAVYEQSERAIIIDLKQDVKSISLEIQGSEESPVFNPVFRINGWGNKGIKLQIDGKAFERGKDFRFGYRQNLDSIDLVSWVRFESTSTVKVVITAL
jgi:hypothetical protein